MVHGTEHAILYATGELGMTAKLLNDLLLISINVIYTARLIDDGLYSFNLWH